MATTMYRVSIKPLSVNDCWKGRRFKTEAYEKYCTDVGFMLPKTFKVPGPGPYRIHLVFGVSNAAADWDNPVKPIQDIMQKKYGFNDKLIYEAFVRKVIVPKGKEFFEFNMEAIEPAT